MVTPVASGGQAFLAFAVLIRNSRACTEFIPLPRPKSPASPAQGRCALGEIGETSD